jgi:hypothetical protein
VGPAEHTRLPLGHTRVLAGADSKLPIIIRAQALYAVLDSGSTNQAVISEYIGQIALRRSESHCLSESIDVSACIGNVFSRVASWHSRVDFAPMVYGIV